MELKQYMQKNSAFSMRKYINAHPYMFGAPALAAIGLSSNSILKSFTDKGFLDFGRNFLESDKVRELAEEIKKLKVKAQEKILEITNPYGLFDEAFKPYIKPIVGMTLGAGSGYLLGNSLDQYGDRPYMPHLGLIGGGITGAFAGDFFNDPQKRVLLNSFKKDN